MKELELCPLFSLVPRPGFDGCSRGTKQLEGTLLSDGSIAVYCGCAGTGMPVAEYKCNLIPLNETAKQMFELAHD